MGITLGLGFLLGMRHALDADHVAAVATLVTRAPTRSECVRHGALWGIGHTLTLAAIGLVVLLVDTVIPERMAAGLELVVGVMLVLLGLDVLRRARLVTMPSRAFGESNPKQGPTGYRRSLLVGFVHGLAGSSALVLLSLQRTDSLGAGLLYIALFGIGSILGMALLSLVISVPLRWSAGALGRFHFALQGAIGLASIGLGMMTLRSAGAGFLLV